MSSTTITEAAAEPCTTMVPYTQRDRFQPSITFKSEDGSITRIKSYNSFWSNPALISNNSWFDGFELGFISWMHQYQNELMHSYTSTPTPIHTCQNIVRLNMMEERLWIDYINTQPEFLIYSYIREL